MNFITTSILLDFLLSLKSSIDNELTILLIKNVFDFSSFKSIASKTIPSVLVVNKIGCIL